MLEWTFYSDLILVRATNLRYFRNDQLLSVKIFMTGKYFYTVLCRKHCGGKCW